MINTKETLVPTYFRLGVDIGSTTAKVVLLNANNEQVFTRYRRHNTEIIITILSILQEIITELGDITLTVAITGTAGMGISEKTNIPFVQEVVAAAGVAKALYPECRTLIDLGGEDAKIIFFNEEMKPDIRMNGACAGGTGAFIDQMATLLGYPVEELSSLADQHQNTYPIASRCGVFAKTDVQNLIARGIQASDIAASIFRAVAYQTVNALARGVDILPKILFVGGPLTFMPALKRAFFDILNINEFDVITTKYNEVFPALGAALDNSPEKTAQPLSLLINSIRNIKEEHISLDTRLDPLFTSKEEFERWNQEYNSSYQVEKFDIKSINPNMPLFLGIDSGSTTTKIVITSEDGAIVAKNYHPNNGNPVDAVTRGLTTVYKDLQALGIQKPNIIRTATTGYGEDLTRFAFKLDDGLVETIAHYTAASHFAPDVSFILDIGGQDMKAIFIEHGIINNLELNESCSSGSGSFIETFAKGLSMSVQHFAQEACYSTAPCDLGTRCTVFMNSKVKQALREGATQGDISAGLAYSVVKNCFNKVLKITDMSLLGDTVVVQGGTFKNPAVLRALEKIIGKKVVRPDICELMGAYGAALVAIDRHHSDPKVSSFIGLEYLHEAQKYTRQTLTCKGCENLCRITQMNFLENEEKRKFYSGNKCEKIFSNKLISSHQGFNMHEFKRELLWSRVMEPNEHHKRPTIGIPRVLNMWDNFAFWHELFVHSGFNVILSDPSTVALAEKGYATVMSENICYPAKITNGHIFNLIEKKVDRIFYPMIIYEKSEFADHVSANEYNCPVVAGYPEVISAAIQPDQKYGIPFDKPSIAFNDIKLLKKGLWNYFHEQLGVKKKIFDEAFELAISADITYRSQIYAKSQEVINLARTENRLLIMLLGRPYHVDALINHKLPEMIAALGIDILTEDSLPPSERIGLKGTDVLTQWSFPNRIYDATVWAGSQTNVEIIHINSFGCGPDAITIDEVKALLQTYGKSPTVIKVDEITSPGSVKLRIRSMIESVAMRSSNFIPQKKERTYTKNFEDIDKKRIILAPDFSPFYTRFIVKSMKDEGYNLKILPEPDRQSIHIGLQYTNNDICYPATIVIGDLLKALQSGEYDTDNVAVALTQTGGQCRASSYISMLKKALINAGFSHVPVVAVNTHADSGNLNRQPGFKLNPTSFILTSLLGLLYGDVIAKLYWTYATYEKEIGTAKKISEKWLEAGEEIIDFKRPNQIFKLMEQAVQEFNTIDTKEGRFPKVGIVGEIFVKFNEFSNNYTAQWLIKNGIEPDFPPLINFFLSTIVQPKHNKQSFVENHSWATLLAIDAAAPLILHFVKKANKVLSDSKLHITPIHDVRHIAKNAAKGMDLVLQFGESWLLPGDIITFVDEGTTDVLCLQPFGCIANHIIAKGMEKRLKSLYPNLNLLFLDMDAGSSEVNIINRLSFLVKGAHDSQRESELLDVTSTTHEDKSTTGEIRSSSVKRA
ncbi:acyl-CoA dehydratase activase [Entomospira nematocerorum]|uniref:CoA activase n=1 Tax=Entomospira nematocerorum TaxID=2719987 RepID=A0A968GEK0_9SPIO|nr:acyl-CoA dehydratase activase [Entomospira nematocera]NIZ46753.1 CoA activase [Entomospira nematocera]WDI33450.1 acyl-CoA dehydratase activase [Entomospira nematocera]